MPTRGKYGLAPGSASALPDALDPDRGLTAPTVDPAFAPGSALGPALGSALDPDWGRTEHQWNLVQQWCQIGAKKWASNAI